MSKKYVIDTSVLMEGMLLENLSECFVPITVIEELDKLKTDKDPAKSFMARNALKEMRKSKPNVIYGTIEFKKFYDSLIKDYGLHETNDNMILALSLWGFKEDKELCLATLDYSMGFKARVLGIPCEVLLDTKKEELYYGYRNLYLSESDMADFYDKSKDYRNELATKFSENEYLILCSDESEQVVDVLRKQKDDFVETNTKSFKSEYFDNIVPKDEYQRCAFDSLHSKGITMLYGKAGSGKTTLALSYLISGLKKGKFRKLYVVHTFETLKRNKTLGFLPGDKNQKILDSSLGNILSTKFGDILPIKLMMAEGKIEIIPTSDLRGCEFGADDAVFITEAQNTDPYTMKTLVQRCKDGCKVVIEGDILEQIDINVPISGMKRMLEVYAGESCFSCVKLKNNYRSEISEIADKMC